MATKAKLDKGDQQLEMVGRNIVPPSTHLKMNINTVENRIIFSNIITNRVEKQTFPMADLEKYAPLMKLMFSDTERVPINECDEFIRLVNMFQIYSSPINIFIIYECVSNSNPDLIGYDLFKAMNAQVRRWDDLSMYRGMTCNYGVKVEQAPDIMIQAYSDNNMLLVLLAETKGKIISYVCDLNDPIYSYLTDNIVIYNEELGPHRINIRSLNINSIDMDNKESKDEDMIPYSVKKSKSMISDIASIYYGKLIDLSIFVSKSLKIDKDSLDMNNMTMLEAELRLDMVYRSKKRLQGKAQDLIKTNISDLIVYGFED